MHRWIVRFSSCFFSVSVAAILFPHSAAASPSISSITDNRASYSGSQIPRYKKLEITFQISGIQAGNLQFPYLSEAESNQYTAGFANQGISVDAVFTAPDGKTYQQPGFYYEQFSDEIRNNTMWMYSQGQFFWKVRFSPNQTGIWSYKIVARDQGGSIESVPVQFTVTSSTSHGFIQVGKTDPRYFEFNDGTYFPGLGYNVALSELSDENEVKILAQNDIRLLRAWLTPFGIWASTWTHWREMPGYYDGYLPRVPIVNASFNGQPQQMYFYVTMGSSWFEPCIFVGHEQPLPPVKPNTSYYGTVTFNAQGITGPRTAGKPFGFTLKTGGWLDNCADAGVGTSLIPDESNTNGFKTVHFSWNSGTNNFLPNFYMTLENASAGKVYIKEISLKEMAGGTLQNPQLTAIEVLDKPFPQEHIYMAQRRSFEMDKIMDLADKYGLYIRPVIEEKNENIFQKLDQQGIPSLTDSNQNYYGNGRTLTGTRWLHQAWWRYLQARWGYSPNIHSWELMNEGDPANTGHYALTDELGAFMKCRAFGVPLPYQDGAGCTFKHPNAHMVSTSFWHSFPKVQFWGNASYPNVDFADVHAYISTGYAPLADSLIMENDSTYYHTWYSADLGGWQLGKPIIRGEAGMDRHDLQDWNAIGIEKDTQGIWLHNYLWAQLHPGALLESYWWTNLHIYTDTFDNRPMYGYFAQFINTIPLNNGNYQDIAATVSNANVRVVGQKDTINGTAHFWVQNKNHTWKNAVDGVNIPSQSAMVAISGFQPNKPYTLETWNTYAGTNTTGSITSSPTGVISLSVSNLATDTAYKIINPTAPTPPPPSPTTYNPQPTPTPSSSCPQKPRGDAGCDGRITLSDFEQWRREFRKEVTSTLADFTPPPGVSLSDYEAWRANFF